MSDDLLGKAGDMMGDLKDKALGGLGLDEMLEKAEGVVEGLKDKVEDVAGEKGAAMFDGFIEKAEDKIEDIAGVKVDLNNNE